MCLQFRCYMTNVKWVEGLTQSNFTSAKSYAVCNYTEEGQWVTLCINHNLLFNFVKTLGKYCTISSVCMYVYLLIYNCFVLFIFFFLLPQGDQYMSIHKVQVYSCIMQWMTRLLRLFCTGHISPSVLLLSWKCDQCDSPVSTFKWFWTKFSA